MRRVQVGIVFGILIILALFVCIMNGRQKKEKQEELAKIEETKQSYVDVNYSEGDEDKDYNYISNPQTLEGMEITVEKAAEFSELINEQLQSNNIRSDVITVTNIEKQGQKYIIKMITLNTNVKINVTYDRKTDELTAVMEL